MDLCLEGKAAWPNVPPTVGPLNYGYLDHYYRANGLRPTAFRASSRSSTSPVKGRSIRLKY